MIVTHNFLTEKSKWYKQWWGIVLIFILFCLLAFVVWFSVVYVETFIKLVKNDYTQPAVMASEQQASNLINMKDLIDSSDPYLGSPNAPLKIIEFGDLLCPVCQQNYTVMRELVAKYPDKVQIFWINYPVISTLSVDYSVAAKCAAMQDKFWAFHDKVFASQDEADLYAITTFAQQIGLDLDFYDTCSQSQEVLAQIQEDYNIGQNLVITGTPTFVINGYLIEGYVPLSIWEQMIQRLDKK